MDLPLKGKEAKNPLLGNLYLYENILYKINKEQFLITLIEKLRNIISTYRY